MSPLFRPHSQPQPQALAPWVSGSHEPRYVCSRPIEEPGSPPTGLRPSPRKAIVESVQTSPAPHSAPPAPSRETLRNYPDFLDGGIAGGVKGTVKNLQNARETEKELLREEAVAGKPDPERAPGWAPMSCCGSTVYKGGPSPEVLDRARSGIKGSAVSQAEPTALPWDSRGAMLPPAGILGKPGCSHHRDRGRILDAPV